MIVGHQKQRDYLKKTIEEDSVSHAYLFIGQDKLGKKRVAMEWASFLLDNDLKNGQHPDLILVQSHSEQDELAEKPKSQKEIQIGQIRDLIWKLSLRPYSAKYKVAIIDQAHLMNQEAQSSLLKTLEEPRGKTVLILISEYPQYLLPTITSRAEILKFYPVKEEEMKKYLAESGVSERDEEEILILSSGRPGLAIDFVSDPEKLKDFQKKIKEISQIANSEIVLRFQYVKQLSEDLGSLKEALDIWLFHFRNILLLTVNQEKKTDGSLKSGQYSLAKLKSILKNIQTTKFLISTTNVSPKLALENLMLAF